MSSSKLQDTELNKCYAKSIGYVFIYSGNEPSDNKINKTIQLIIASKNNKGGINLPEKYETSSV